MSVFCAIIDYDKRPFGLPFPMHYQPDLYIDELITELFSDMTRVERAQVQVYVTRKINREVSPDEMETALSELDLGEGRVAPYQVMAKVVSPGEFLVFRKPAPPGTSVKWPRSPTSITTRVRRLRNAKVLNLAPSDAATLGRYWKYQKDSDERWLDDRPHPDFHVAPVPLLYAPFGEFDDIFAGRVSHPADVDFNIKFATLLENVNELAAAMSLPYKLELDRRDAALHLLRKIFEHDEAFQTDGHSEIEGLVDLIVEVKNELVGISALPYVQSAGYVGQSHKNAETIEVLCDRWRLPALCITIVGFQIQFYAVILLGHQYRIVSLTPSLSCAPQATNGWDRKHLYTAFAAAIVLRHRIRSSLQSYTQLASVPPVLADKEFFFPALSKILKYGCSTDHKEYIEFKILDHYGEKLHYRQLYKASLSDDDGTSRGDILVKFTRRYCVDLHDYCSKKGNAPKLLGFQQLPGDWLAVAMEYIPNAEHINSVLHRGEKDAMLYDLVNGFHEKGLVHGDLRYTNILCDGDGQNVWLIDFDWAGKAGEVEYPTWLLNAELRCGRRLEDLKIRKEDDMRILGNTLKALRS